MRLSALLGLVLLAPAFLHAELRVPEGFTVTQVAGPELADNIYAMTLDREGRPIVSGPRYIRTLIDDDDDGVYDRAMDWPHAPRSGAMGLCMDDDGTLLLHGDGQIQRITDDPDSAPIKLWKAGNGEHGMHAIIRGPEGWFYGVGGNRAKLKGLDYTYGTKIEAPHAGSIFRFSKDGKQLESVAQGFRNSYDIAFNPEGQLFTFDSDSERWHHLPHYTPMRLYDVELGGHHGWMYERTDRAWKRPDHFPDTVPMLATLGRGSPTGLTCYRHRQFPERYRNSLFGLCWSSGRVFHFPLAKKGATYSCAPETFLEAMGGTAFPACDIEVTPEGDLLVAIGGRGTRGALYRIRHGEPLSPQIDVALTADMPLSAWSRAGWLEAVDNADPSDFARAAMDNKRPVAERVRAVDVLREFYPEVLIEVMTLDLPGPVGARMARAGISNQITSPENARAHVEEGTDIVIDFEAEAVMEMQDPWLLRIQSGVRQLPPVLPTVMYRMMNKDLKSPRHNLAHKRTIVRILQVGMGDIDTQVDAVDAIGYAALSPLPLDASGIKIPSGDPTLDRELGRLFAMANSTDSSLVTNLMSFVTADTAPEDDLHWLFCTGQMPAPRTPASRRMIASAFANLHAKMDAANKAFTRHWPLRVGASFATHCRLDPDLPQAFMQDPGFGHPGHVLFIGELPLEARRLLAKSPWTPELVQALDLLPDEELLPMLRGALATTTNLPVAVSDETAILLAKRGTAADLPLLAPRLNAAAPTTSERLARALGRHLLTDTALCLGALQARARHRAHPKAKHELATLLTAWTGQESDWRGWFEAKHPELAAELSAFGQQTDWPVRLASVDWRSGDAARGKAVYESRACASCHDGSRRLGPSLKGVGKRFDRDALFAAIVNPHADISPAFKAIEVKTRSGETHVGAPVYDSPALTILETGPGATVMLKDIVERGPATRSTMPEGLLDGASDQELSDLHAYLLGL